MSHIINVHIGEDVMMKVILFSQQGSHMICILSTNGVISSVTLRQPDSSGGTLTYEVEAVGGDSFRKLAVRSVTFGPDSVTIHGIMQCTPDLSKEQCSECLDGAVRELRLCCSGRVAARVFYPNCFVRYLNENFYNDPPLISVPSKLARGTDCSYCKFAMLFVCCIC
ncbi:putative AT-hook motif nuclear-localized protein [Helianthus annuus]|nr:putative AT-hook motif nuclear-localized protein [Helianthus annuus]